VVAEGALLHHVLLVRRCLGIADRMVDRELRLVPVELTHARVGAGGHAHAAADALVVVLAYDARLGVLVGGAHGAHVHACGVVAMLAAHGNEAHGGVGENGDLAGFFQVNKIKYTSAGALASHIAMDKNLTKELVKDIVPVVKGVKVAKSNFDEITKQIDETFAFDLIVKPNSLGSSIGVKACNIENYKDQIEAIFEMSDDALVEDRVVEIEEFNQACFKSKEGLVLSAIEHPISKHEFLTFEDKYKTKSKTKGSDREIPAKISPELEEQIINYTSKIYEKLNMNGVVRIDYILDKATNTLYFNEINTIPGSMAFYLYEPLGIDYITLVENLIENAEDIKKFAYFNTQILNDKKI